jgi:predicted cupin superfamily sugar epimerase
VRLDVPKLIHLLDLQPHPEGGWYRETWVAASSLGERPSGSAIYFLLDGGGMSRLHRIDADELWHYYLGSPLELRTGDRHDDLEVSVLGADVLHGQQPQLLVPSGCWQQARSLGEFSLAGCTVSPAFRFEGFELFE